VADNIVHMRAQYGLDDGVKDGSVPFNTGAGVAGDGLVDRFVSATTFNALAPLPWQSLIAVRVAVVARSALAEKPHGSNGTDCDATTDGTEGPSVPDQRPVWSGGLIDVSATGDPSPSSPLYWKCYRYRVFETTVPLRNWIWKSS
jgi:type IV pilus assembly protein PilW